MSTEQIVFGPFRFDPIALHLWKDEQVVAVQPKPLAVLRALATRPGQVVTKQELLKEMWAGTYVTQAVLKVAIRALREALGESADAPQYLETIEREGYRFLEEGVSQQEEENQKSKGKGQKAKTELPSPAHIIVGREAELAQLHKWLGKALRGEPQFVFITGEPGIGKTTVVDVFRAQVQATGTISLGYGQCIEHYGQGEPYLPVLEAIGRLCREAGGQQIVTLLRKHAPTWLVQLSGVIEEGEMQALRLQVQGATQQRMLREIAEAIEVGTVRRPLVLIFEDLHWSDSATIEFLAYLAKRRQPMRLLVVATYRPVDVVMGAHPVKIVKQELQAHGLCEEVRLELLKKKEIEAYVAKRFPESEVARVLAPEVYRRTEGNPLFMVNVVEHCINQGLVVQEQGRWALTGEVEELRVPESVRQLIVQQVERLSEAQRQVLEGASVTGAEFVVAAVAAAVKQEMDEVETVCEEIAGQGHFLEERGIAEWPDGTISGRYGFCHALYQNVPYDRIAEARKIRLHRLIGERLETGYDERAGEIAAELAVHFERGHEYPRAVRYCEQAGKNAIRRSAHREAIAHLTRGLELLKILPDTPERAQQELTLQIALGASLLATKGFGATEVGRAYARARELCQLTGETSQLFPILRGLWEFYEVRAEYQTAQELGEQLLALAQRQPDSSLLLLAHNVLGDTLLYLGECSVAREHLEQGWALYDVHQHRSHAFLYGYDSGVHCLFYAAWALWLLGYPDQALKKIHAALSLARDLSHPFTFVMALHVASIVHLLRREAQAVQEGAETEIALCTEQGFALFLAGGSMYRGWALVEQGQGKEGIAQIHQALIAWQATGTEMQRPHFLALLAGAYGKVGEAEQGLAALVEALAQVEKTGERWYEAEQYRTKGELLLAQEGKEASQKAKIKAQKSKVSPNT